MGITFIAEAGVNHNGDKDIAYKLIDAAVIAGADIVKFQTFDGAALASADAPKAAYQYITTDAAETQLDMLKCLELPKDWHFELSNYCQKQGIEFLSSPFDINSLRFLIDDLGMETIKVPSGEITNGPFILEIAKTANRIIVSTGMCTIDDVHGALGVLAFGLIGAPGIPSRDAFKAAFDSDTGQSVLKDKVTLLHCTSAYPTPLEDANVLAMVTLKDHFGLNVGFSDHTEGATAALSAAALGASIIEKHFTLDRDLPGPDHKASLEPNELSDLVHGIHTVSIALGDGIKMPQPSEIDTIDVIRKSLVTLSPIQEGEAFSPENLGAKRPGDGVSPMEYWDRLGTANPRQLSDGEKL
jgi:N-acetylneuraminate synthase